MQMYNNRSIKKAWDIKYIHEGGSKHGMSKVVYA